jgi:hypothetical protein
MSPEQYKKWEREAFDLPVTFPMPPKPKLGTQKASNDFQLTPTK